MWQPSFVYLKPSQTMRESNVKIGMFFGVIRPRQRLFACYNQDIKYMQGSGNMKILNFGSCNIDYVYDVDSIVRPGETLQVQTLKQYPGGKGLNQTIALARANSHVWHAGCIGEDGLFLKQLMEDNNVHTEYLQVIDELTGQAIIQVEPTGENCILVYGGANVRNTKEYIDQVLASFEENDFLVLQKEINNVEYIIEKAYERKMKIVLNPSPCNEVLKRVDLNKIAYLVLNEIEATFFSEIEDPYDSVLQLIRKYPTLSVVLTLGGKGCFYTEKGMVLHHPAFKAKAVDTTAAGDTFAGYFVSCLYKGKTMAESIKIANAAAGIAIQTKGAAPSIPTMDYVEEKMQTMELQENEGIDWKKKLVDNYLFHNIKDANLDDLAELLHYSPSYLSRWIGANMGKPFSEILQEKRCSLAADYLKNTEMPIQTIIEEVGYNNEGFFRKIFSNMYGMMPLEYRKFKK